MRKFIKLTGEKVISFKSKLFKSEIQFKKGVNMDSPQSDLYESLCDGESISDVEFGLLKHSFNRIHSKVGFFQFCED